MPDNERTPIAEAESPQSSAKLTELEARVKAAEERQKLAETKAADERKKRISNAVSLICAERGQNPDDWISLVNDAADEERAAKIMANLGKLPLVFTNPAGPGNFRYGNEGPLDQLKAIKGHKERFEFTRDNWHDLRMAEASFLKRGAPMGANTTSATITTSMLADGAVTILRNKLASLALLSRDFGVDPMKTRAAVVFRYISAGGTAQSNATSFEDTTNFVGTVDPKTYTPAQLTAGGHITNAELNSGFRMADWAIIKSQEIAEKVMAAVAAVILEATYTITPVVAAAAAFGTGDLRLL